MDHECLFQLNSITKTYGATTALSDVSLTIRRGEILCLIGSNGAGKSTLMRVVSGVTEPDSGGTLVFEGEQLSAKSYNPAVANRLGIRVVYQELSLCTNLSVYENFYIDQHESYKGNLHWRKDLVVSSTEALEGVFPGNGIQPKVRLGNLSLSNRQMVEIARAASMKGLKLLILDEPTSSLGVHETQQLIAHLKELSRQGISIIFISHRLSEVIQLADRIVVMRNGKKTWEGRNEGIDELDLVERMTESVDPSQEHRVKEKIPLTKKNEELFLRTHRLSQRKLGGIDVSLQGGELVGIAGLDGNGQRDFLKAVFFGRHSKQIEMSGKVCYVTGDRKKEGIFPLSDISDNMQVVEVNKSSPFGILDTKALAAKVKKWYEHLQIKAEGPHASILSLSGGNQQKVLVARAFLADADIIILDDPTKGVDIATKNQMYLLFREAAANGKLVIWYSTEDDELEWCSRVLVFRYGKVVKELEGDDIQKSQIIEASFEGEDLLDKTQGQKTGMHRFQSSIWVPLAAMLSVFIISGIYQRGVFTSFGIDLLISGAVPLVFAAMAQMFIIGLSQIDLGIGAYMGLINVLCATWLLDKPLVGVLFILGSVVVYGVIGAIIYIRNIPAVIVTMGMSYVWLGIAYTIQERPGGEAPQWLVKMFNLDLPVPESLLLILLAGLAAYLFYRSKYGTVLRGFGNNVSAVQRSGWSPLKAFICGYALASLFAIVGGMAITASTGASDVNSTTSYTLLTVASVVIGGSELVGGIVSSYGSVIGAITLSLISALLGFMRLNSSWVTAVQGIILIVILASRLLRKVKV